MEGSTPTRWDAFSEVEKTVLSSALASVSAATLAAASEGPLQDREEREAVAGTILQLGLLHLDLEHARGLVTPPEDTLRAVVAAVLNNEYHELMKAPVEVV